MKVFVRQNDKHTQNLSHFFKLFYNIPYLNKTEIPNGLSVTG